MPSDGFGQGHPTYTTCPGNLGSNRRHCQTCKGRRCGFILVFGGRPRQQVSPSAICRSLASTNVLADRLAIAHVNVRHNVARPHHDRSLRLQTDARTLRAKPRRTFRGSDPHRGNVEALYARPNSLSEGV